MAHPLVTTGEKINILDRELSHRDRRKTRTKLIVRTILIVAVFILFFAGFRYFIHPSLKFSEILITTAERGKVEASVTASGTILPAFEEIVTSPVQSQITAIYFNNGDRVLAGDALLELDKESAQLMLEKKSEELLLQKNKVNQLKLQLEKKIIDLKTNHQIKKLHTARLEENVKEEQYMLDLGGGTKEKLKQVKLNLQIARIEMNQIEQTMENSRLTMEADLEELQHQINIQEKSVNELQKKLKQAEVRANKAGVITWIDNQIGKSVNPGSRLATIANLESFKAEGRISDIYADILMPSGKVVLRLTKSAEVDGRITSVMPTVDNNVVRFNIRLDEPSHPALRPNMQADVFVVTALRENVIRIKNGAFYRGGNEQVVFVVQGNKAIRRNVIFGKSNFDWVEVVEGLQAAERVVISDMSDYEHINQIKLK